MESIFVRPAAGSRVRQPERASRVMPESGDRVPRNSYYERLILAGDVVLADQASPPTTPPVRAAAKRSKEK